MQVYLQVTSSGTSSFTEPPDSVCVLDAKFVKSVHPMHPEVVSKNQAGFTRTLFPGGMCVQALTSLPDFTTVVTFARQICRVGCPS